MKHREISDSQLEKLQQLVESLFDNNEKSTLYEIIDILSDIEDQPHTLGITDTQLRIFIKLVERNTDCLQMECLLKSLKHMLEVNNE